jgi:C4-dicarboxylate transporter DctM subunit
MILYNIVVEHSIIDMFIAGIVPGLLLTIVLTGYSLFANRQMPSIRFDGRKFLLVLRNGFLAMMMPVILLGGIYLGYFSATEAAVVSVGYAIIIEVFIHKELGIANLFGVAVDAAKLFGIIMVVNLEIGFITPPMGLNLIIAMTAFKENFLLICRSVLLFIAMMLLVLILISWFPVISIGILD